MRDIAPALAARLGGATTLCHCWRLLLQDGTRLGFTDHDENITFDSTVFAAASGFDAGAVDSELGLSIGGGEVSGALSADAIEEADLVGGRYDGARVETWLVDWTTTEARLLFDVGVIGEVRRSEFAFTAEVRSLAAYFDEPQGRYFQLGCAADLGDSRCMIDLTQPAYRCVGVVASTDGRMMLTVAGAGFADGFFTGGSVLFTSGANAGQRATIKSHRDDAGAAIVSLWAATGKSIAAGDAVILVAGCDKSLATCTAKFANQVNFRGFPHMPGNDVLMSYPNADDPAMDGGSLFR
jgi:uncharacterized phage protein (TIGR02218 family)